MSAPLQLDSAQALWSAAEGPRFLLFKHSLVCPVSDRAFRQYARFLKEVDAESGWVDVIGQRPLSQEVAARSGVAHESPQALLFVGGRVVWNASHGAITADALAEAWRASGAQSAS